MVDTTKRNTLKALTAGTAVAAAPGVAHAIASNKPGTTHSNLSAVVDHLRAHLADRGLDINVVPTPGHASLAIQVRNVSEDVVWLPHVGPGLLRSGGDLYDVNDMLSNSGERYYPGEAYRYVITPVSQAA